MRSNRDGNPGGTKTYVDAFDRTIGVLHSLPDVVSTKSYVTRVVPPLGIGGTQLYVVQTYRQKKKSRATRSSSSMSAKREPCVLSSRHKFRLSSLASANN
ncbi:MAG TPA: hypothetical protein VFR18_02300 [Terriglobia bacterium]|nr:hypothetical protein [Terriglobia bacterium]